ncbi:MAG: hypothetical protein K6G81_03960 [Lachnospiraceae bacterium]|nr:hypothetical protein [Lachnospiraceae bacterium]
MKLYKRLSVLLTMGIMGIGLISFSTVPGMASGVPEKKVIEETTVSATPVPDEQPVSPTPTPTPGVTATPTPAPNYLQKDSNSNITELVKAYLAAKLTCSREAFEGIVTDTSYINIDLLMIQTETVLSYDLLSCYTKRGYGPVDYVVYYKYTMDITTVESPALSIDALYVTVDDDGAYKVFLGKLDDDVEKQLDKLNQDADVQAVVGEVMQQIANDIENDESLLQYWQRLYDQLGMEFNIGMAQNVEEGGNNESSASSR